MAKATFGTGSFVLLHSGFTAPEPGPGLLATVASQIGPAPAPGTPPQPAASELDPAKPVLGGSATPALGTSMPMRRSATHAAGLAYALEASIFVTGAAVQWLRDELQIIERAEDTAALAASLDANDGVYFVPALTGLGSPHWDPHARGTIVGLTRGTGRAHLARATLEAIAYQTLDAVRAMQDATAHPLSELRADGGSERERLADAVPGRRARRAGRARREHRDDGARRRLPGGRRRGDVDGCGRARLLARGRALRAADGRG